MTAGITKIYRRDNQPFAQIPNQAIRDPRITSNGFRLLAYLMSHADGYELTYNQIEHETALGRFAINAAIQNLKELGWLETSRTKLPNGQFGPTAWIVKEPTSATVGNSTAGHSTMEQPTDNKNINIKEDHIKNTYPQAELEGAFAEFWTLYPRKVEKIAARKAFEKALTQADVQTILEGTKRLASDPNLPEKAYLKHPASWLNAGGWEDEPYPERPRTPQQIREDLEHQRAAKIARERELDRLENLRRQEEQARIARELKVNPPKHCKHGRVEVICPTCTSLRNATDQ